jgi:hypothetical protein
LQASSRPQARGNTSSTNGRSPTDQHGTYPTRLEAVWPPAARTGSASSSRAGTVAAAAACTAARTPCTSRISPADTARPVSRCSPRATASASSVAEAARKRAARSVVDRPSVSLSTRRPSVPTVALRIRARAPGCPPARQVRQERVRSAQRCKSCTGV